MCRLVAVKSTTPIQLAHLLTKPRHSIIKQSSDSRLRADGVPTNGDGFGVGWYDSVQDEELGVEPCIFKSLTPAWNNANLIRLANKTKSPLVLAHVRASSAGSVSEDNCHPWHFGKIMFMHNGGIKDFSKLKFALQQEVARHWSKELFLFPQGNTDSEWAFALFLTKLLPHTEASSPKAALEKATSSNFTHQELQNAMLATLTHLNLLARNCEIVGRSMLNFVVTDGASIVAIRYISSKTEAAASLYFSSGTTFHKQGPNYRMTKSAKRENIIMIASEPLTFQQADWMEIETNSMVVITPKMNILQIPIDDEFTNRNARGAEGADRDVGYARANGMWNQNPLRPQQAAPREEAGPSVIPTPASAVVEAQA